jgi:hypothetical protein
MLSKRGDPSKVDEAFMSRCNSFGMRTFGNVLAKEARQGDASHRSAQGQYEAKCKELNYDKKNFEHWKWLEQQRMKNWNQH